MTKTFASNKYRENGVEHCNDKKSACVSMEGMKIYDHYKNPTKHVGLVQRGHHYHLIMNSWNVTCSHHDRNS
jgi:hypothetical protein